MSDVGSAVRSFLSAMLVAIALIAPRAEGTSFTTDQSDIWSVPGEDGWGFQMVQRDTTIFVTLYVYDQQNIAIWYTATLQYTGNFTWTGDLYESEGPWLGTIPFNPAAVTLRKVGTMTWFATTVNTGVLHYDVDGFAVVKNASRFTLVYDDFGGRYGGITHFTASGCANAGLNGTIESLGVLNIVQNGLALTLTSTTTSGGSCTFSGTLSQAGQMGSTTGSYSCSSGDAGSFQIYEMQVNTIGITGRITAGSAAFAGCQLSGHFGGARITTF